MDRNAKDVDVDIDGIEVADLGVQMRSAIGRVYRRFRSERPEGGLGDAALEVLAWLHKHGPHTLTELSAEAHVSPASMSQTVNRLASAGYVVRTGDPTDGRKVLFSTTPTGAKLGGDTIAQRNAWLESRLGSLSPDEKMILLQASAILNALVRD